MIRPRVSLLFAGVLVSLVGCTAHSGSGGSVSGSMRDFLRRYGSFSPAEAIAIAVQIERGPRDLARQRAAARREGVLLTPQDLQAPLPLPQRNAAPVYLRLTRLLQTKPLSAATRKVMGSLGMRVKHPESEVAAVRRALTERPELLRLAHEAASRPECVFRRDWKRGLLLEYPEHVTIREVARLLSTESYFLARDGRYQEAVANEALVFRVADQAAAGTTAICQLVGMACDAIALAGMENILCTAGPQSAAAEAVRRAVATQRPHLRLRRALQGEIVLYSVTMNGLRQRGGTAPGPSGPGAGSNPQNSGSIPPDLAKTTRDLPPSTRPIGAHCLDAGEACNLSLMRQLIVASGQPYARGKQLLQRFDELNAETTLNPVLQLAGPALVLGKVLTRGVQTRAQEEAIIAGAAVLAYEARHSALPDRLEQAIAQPPHNPFGTGTLEYRREAVGFVVYSAGPDGNFDGSRPGAPRVRDQAYFRYPATPQPAQQN